MIILGRGEQGLLPYDAPSEQPAAVDQPAQLTAAHWGQNEGIDAAAPGTLVRSPVHELGYELQLPTALVPLDLETAFDGRRGPDLNASAAVAGSSASEAAYSTSSLYTPNGCGSPG